MPDFVALRSEPNGLLLAPAGAKVVRL